MAALQLVAAAELTTATLQGELVVSGTLNNQEAYFEMVVGGVFVNGVGAGPAAQGFATLIQQVNALLAEDGCQFRVELETDTFEVVVGSQTGMLLINKITAIGLLLAEDDA